MDRTSWIAVGLCVIVFVWWTSYSSTHYAQPVRKPAPSVAASGAGAGNQTALTSPNLVPSSEPVFPSIGPAPAAHAATAVLENDFMRVTFTSNGGAIQKVELLKHKVGENRQVTLNEDQEEPILNLAGWDNTSLMGYELVPSGTVGDAKAGSVTFRRVLAKGGQLERTYTLSGPYQLSLVQSIKNPTLEPFKLPGYLINLGLSTPLYSVDSPTTLHVCWLTRNDKYQSKGLADFDAPGFLMFHWGQAQSTVKSEIAPLRWVAVKNQFFCTVLTTPIELPAVQSLSKKVTMPQFEVNGRPANALKSYALFDEINLPAQGSITSKFDIYTGPKEYQQIKRLAQDQENLLEFGWLGWIIKFLLTSMNYVHQGVSSWNWHWDLNYGWVVIIITIIIKILLWPLQSAANKSMKQMQALQPRIKELQERYKEDPQKLQGEMMKIYQDYGVNPVGGCLPMVVQIPILIAFYTMLQSAIELRHVSWLWVHDLSQPDTIFTLNLLGFPLALNPLPISMTLTQWLLMKMTPTTQDNQQMKIMQWMPFLFLFMLYNFAAALSLYWTVNNLVTIVQTYRNLKKPLPILERKKKAARPNPFGQKRL